MSKKGYSISIIELLERPIIRDDYNEEWMNKMTNEELDQWHKETYALCVKAGTSAIYPDLNVAHLSKHIDRTILYTLFKKKNV